jgi:methionyl-tRNA formyltransferase
VADIRQQEETKGNMQIVFMGTPAFAVPTLEALHHKGHKVLSVFAQPDRPAGRGRGIAFSPVKQKAMELGLHFKLFQT